jgi:hypothetical protein
MGIVVLRMVAMCVSMMVIMVRVGILVKAFLAMKDQEVKAERIKGCNKNTGQNSKVGKPGACKMACVYRFDDAVF